MSGSGICVWGVLLAVAAFVAVAVLVPSVARAEEPQNERAALAAAVRDHVRTIRIHRRQDDIYELAEDVWAVVRLYREAAQVPGSRTQRAVLLRTVGSLTRYPDERVRPVALEALAEMGDPRGLEYVRPFLRPSNCSEINRTTIAAIEAAATLKGESCVFNLIGILRRSKCPCEVLRAIRALGGFRSCPRYREKILTVLEDHLQREACKGLIAVDDRVPSRPLHAGDASVSYAPRVAPTRSERIQSALTDALNELTGQSFRAASDWLRFLRKGERSEAEVFAPE